MRKKKAPKGKQETARLAHKVKQEMKNAVREIRKDTAFIANQQLREELEKFV
jgi:nucleolar protein 14